MTQKLVIDINIIKLHVTKHKHMNASDGPEAPYQSSKYSKYICYHVHTSQISYSSPEVVKYAIHS